MEQYLTHTGKILNSLALRCAAAADTWQVRAVLQFIIACTLSYKW